MIKLSTRSSRFYLFVSIAAAVLAAICLLFYLQGLRSRIAASGELVKLVVAARDMDAGEVLGLSDLSLVDFPDIYMLPGTCSDPLELTGSTLRCAVGAGEPLLASSLLPAGGGGLTQDSLDRGFRAFPLPSSSISFPASELHAGSRVDVLSVTGGAAATLLENIEVLYVHGMPVFSAADGDAASAGPYTGGCIMLQVTGEEACRLAAARENGVVELLLRAAE